MLHWRTSDETMKCPKPTAEITITMPTTRKLCNGDTTSFYDKLKEQVGEIDLNPQEEEVLLYIIGSLDSDGLLRKDLESIADELAISITLTWKRQTSKRC